MFIYFAEDHINDYNAVLTKILENSYANLNNSFTSLLSLPSSHRQHRLRRNAIMPRDYFIQHKLNKKKPSQLWQTKHGGLKIWKYYHQRWLRNFFFCIESYKDDNNNLIFTIFLLQYLKITTQTGNVDYQNNTKYVALVETTSYGVILNIKIGRMQL